MGREPRIRLLLGLLVIGPALALGGTSPWTVPPFAALVAALCGACIVGRTSRRVPLCAAVGLAAAVFTALQVLPVPGLREAIAPGLDDWIAHAMVGIDGQAWASMSPTPADTAVEVVRLLALAGLALAAAQRSWRVSAAAVALAGALVAAVGLLQYGLGVDRIYGLYEAKHGALELSPALLTTFVSPNHQSGLLLLGLFATAGLLVDGRVGTQEGQRLDRRVALGIALVLQLAALVLSMSRAALLVAMFVAPLAALVAWWPEDRAYSRSLARIAPRMAAVVTLVGIAIGLGTLGAWHELQTLLMGDGVDPSTAARLRVTLASTDLLDLAPVTGIGRGAYGDLFTAFDPAPNHVWYSHLECAPLTFVVEWGVIMGGALAVALPAWWLGAMRRSGDHEDARARRIVLLGLLAVALQGLADFSLEFLGVAAPAAALAGALSPVFRRGASSRRLRWAAVGLAGMAVASVVLVPHTWVYRGEISSTDASRSMSARPLDASYHRRLARDAASAGDWAMARTRARVAVRLSPGQVDGWLLLAAAAHARGDGRGDAPCDPRGACPPACAARPGSARVPGRRISRAAATRALDPGRRRGMGSAGAGVAGGVCGPCRCDGGGLGRSIPDRSRGTAYAGRGQSSARAARVGPTSRPALATARSDRRPRPPRCGAGPSDRPIPPTGRRPRRSPKGSGRG